MPKTSMRFAHDCLKQYDEALHVFELALRDRNEELGQDDYSSFVNGKLYMGWGNVMAAQGRLDDSFKLHIICLEQYKQSVGNFHHRTGNGCVKVSDHFSRTRDGPTARALLDQALRIFNLDAYHRPEAARAHYKKGKVLDRMDKQEEARKELDAALEIFNSIVPLEDCVGSIDELDDEDFHHWIIFRSRNSDHAQFVLRPLRRNETLLGTPKLRSVLFLDKGSFDFRTVFPLIHVAVCKMKT